LRGLFKRMRGTIRRSILKSALLVAASSPEPLAS
jgi:hypothetical protein